MPVDKQRFRHIGGAFATGVTVITTGRDGYYHGMTANAFATVSLEPALVLVCVDKTAHTYPVLDSSGAFNVNILAEDQQEVSRLFANKELQESHGLSGMDFHIGVNGVPVLASCLAYMQCRVVARYDGGDHTIYIGEVEEADLGKDGAPLLFYRSAYRRLAE